MLRREADFQTKAAKIVQEHKDLLGRGGSFALEYKVAPGKTFSLTTWRKKQPNQLYDLLSASCDQGLYHKISDSGIGRKTIDAFMLVKCPAYLVIYFSISKECYFIEINSIKHKLGTISEAECISLCTLQRQQNQ